EDARQRPPSSRCTTVSGGRMREARRGAAGRAVTSPSPDRSYSRRQSAWCRCSRRERSLIAHAAVNRLFSSPQKRWRRNNVAAMRRPIVAVALVLTTAMGRAQAPREQALVPDYVKASVVAPPESIQHDPFYKKYADALGISILSSERVPDAALLVARDIVIHMLAKRPDRRREMVAKGMRVGVMAVTESTTDIPEHRDRKKPPPGDPRLTPGEKRGYETGTGIAVMSDKEYWDRRARGLGGNPTTCAEENLLGYPGTRYYGENIFVHEFSHAVMGVAIRTVDPDL